MIVDGFKVIETNYNGYRFRSRTEARWAVFFDELGIKYDYELEGFKLEDGTCYLPDFYLPELECFVEVKPDYISDFDMKKVLLFSNINSIALTHGNPGSKSLTLYCQGPESGSDVFFYLETKGKNEVDGKKVPFWKWWVCAGKYLYDDGFCEDSFYRPAFLAAKRHRFEVDYKIYIDKKREEEIHHDDCDCRLEKIECQGDCGCSCDDCNDLRIAMDSAFND